MVETAITLAPPSRPSGLVARKLAAHLFTLLFFAAWEATSFVAPSYLLPSPVQVAQRLWIFVTSWRDLGHLGSSLFHVAAAIAISFAIGSLLALIPYYVPVLRLAIERRIGPFLNSFSAIGWMPLPPKPVRFARSTSRDSGNYGPRLRIFRRRFRRNASIGC